MHKTIFLIIVSLGFLPFGLVGQIEHQALGIIITEVHSQKSWQSKEVALNDSVSFEQHRIFTDEGIILTIYDPKINSKGALSNLQHLHEIYLAETETMKQKKNASYYFSSDENEEVIRKAVYQNKGTDTTGNFGLRMFLYGNVFIKLQYINPVLSSSIETIPKEFTELSCKPIN